MLVTDSVRVTVQDFEHACVAIHRNLHTRFQQTDVDAADGWLAVLPCTQGTMLEGTSTLQDHCRTSDKQRSPCWISENRCQDLAPFESLPGAQQLPQVHGGLAHRLVNLFNLPC